MALLGDLVVRIVGDTHQFTQSLTRVKRGVDQFDRDLKKIARTAQNLGQQMTRFVTLPIVGLGAAFVKVASDAEETNAKFNTVFREQADAVRDWAQEFSRSVGRSTTENLGFLASVQDLFVPLGASREAAAEFAKGVVQLSTDLGSFNNLRTADVMRDIQSTLVGNFETTRKYGVVLSAAIVEQEAFNRGLISSKDELTPLIKAQVAYQLLMEGTADAQGDAARTAGSTANQFRALKAEALDLAESFGKLLLPLVNDLIASVRSVVQRFTDMDDRTKKLIISVAGMAAAVGPLLLITAKAITTFRILRSATIALNLAMSTNPAFAVAAGITAIAAALTIAIPKIVQAVRRHREYKELLEDTTSVVEGLSEAEQKAARERLQANQLETQIALTRAIRKETEARTELEELRAKGRDATREEFRRIGELELSIPNLTDNVTDLRAEYGQITEAINKVNAALAANTEAVDENTGEPGTGEGLGGNTDAIDANVDASDRLIASLELRNSIYREQREHLEAMREALARYREEQEAAAEDDVFTIGRDIGRGPSVVAGQFFGDDGTAPYQIEFERFVSTRNAILAANEEHLNKMRAALKEYLSGDDGSVEEVVKREVDLWKNAFSTISSFSNSLLQIRQNNAQAAADAAIAALDEELLGEEAYDKEVRRIRREQAEADQAAARTNVLLSTAQAAARAFYDYPWPASLAISGLAAIEALGQLAVINSTPLPALAEGGVTPALLHPDEAVIPLTDSRALSMMADAMARANVSTGGEQMMHLEVDIDSDVFLNKIFPATQDRRVLISARSVV